MSGHSITLHLDDRLDGEAIDVERAASLEQGHESAGKGGTRAVFSGHGVRRASRYLRSRDVLRAQRLQILQSFELETIVVRQAGADEFGLRFYDGVNASPRGRYLFETFPASRGSLAVKSEWNKMTDFAQWRIKPGTVLIEGRTTGQGAGLRGGHLQKFVLDLEALLSP